MNVFSSHKKINTKICAVLLVLSFLAPLSASAQSGGIGYEPRTQSEKIAYLYGRIAMLIEIQQALIAGKSLPTGASQTTYNFVVNDTHKAQQVNALDAILVGEVTLYGRATAYAWFEYGQNKNFLDQKTSRSHIRSAYDRAVRIQVRNLEEDETYYYRVVTEANDKTVSYGPIYSFRTDEVD